MDCHQQESFNQSENFQMQFRQYEESVHHNSERFHQFGASPQMLNQSTVLETGDPIP